MHGVWITHGVHASFHIASAPVVCCSIELHGRLEPVVHEYFVREAEHQRSQTEKRGLLHIFFVVWPMDVHCNLVGRLLEAHGHPHNPVHRDRVSKGIHRFSRFISNSEADHHAKSVMRPKLFAITRHIDGDGLLEQPGKFHMHQQSKGRTDLLPHTGLRGS